MTEQTSATSSPLSRWWDGLPPQTKRVVIAIGALVGIGSFMVVYQGYMTATRDANRQRVTESQVGDILLTTDPRQLGIQTINNDVDALKRTIADLKESDARMDGQLQELLALARANAGDGGPQSRENPPGTEDASTAPETDASVDAGGTGVRPLNRTDAAVAEFRRNNPAAADAPSSPLTGPTSAPQRPPQGAVQPAGATPLPTPAEIFVIDASGRRASGSTAAGETSESGVAAPRAAVGGDEAATATPAAHPGNYLPAGSFLTGTLLTGADVPTGRGTQSQPVPVFVRVKLETILPNRFTTDLAECHVVASAVGDLSSERVLLRSDLLSCVREDGGVLEVPVQMSASGPDGKAGVRGTLVSREGQFLGRALLAGFADGVGRAFAPQRVPVFQSDGQGFVSPPVSDSLQYGAAEGIGSAMQRLADYYMDRADQMFPVIELAAGTEVTFGVLSGRALANLDSTQ